MAEAVAVIGLIASVVSIIDGIGKTKALWKAYFHSSASLRAELLPILGKLTAFAGILRGIQLQCELDEADADRLQILAKIKQPLKVSEEAVRLISARLDQIVSLGRVSFSFGKVLNKETTAALNILDQAKSVLDLALSADQMTLSKSIEVYVRNVASDLRDFRLENKSYYQDVKEQLRDIQTKAVDDAEAKNKTDVLAWISQADYSSNYEAARQPIRQDDTSGNWFIAGDEFQRWIAHGKDAKILLSGISGSGKTVLCAKAIEYLAQRKAVSGTQPTILYHFFDFNDAAKESVEGMIRALLSQLLLQMQGVPKEVQTYYDKQHGPASTELSTQSWIDLLCTQIHSMQDVFIFIDALDECTGLETALLAETLSKLFSKFDDSVRWLLTCRPNARTISDLQGAGFRNMNMVVATVDKDINTYLTACLNSDAKFSSFSHDAKSCIVSGITSKSSGMFRYAQCQLEAIAKLRDRRIKKVKEVLQSMPRTIFESYQRILTDAQLLDDWPLVERILLLVSFSTRPVTVAEVAEFAILEDDTVGLDEEDRLDTSDILASVNTMVTVHEGLVTLAHKSVQDFIEACAEPSSMFSLWPDADISIATRCLRYLRMPQEPLVNLSGAMGSKEPNTSHLRHLLQQYPFLDYAATRWSQHLREKQEQQELGALLASTLPLAAEPNLWKAWLLLQRADIWENQVQLAGTLCEAFIRGALIPGWSLNFWQERQRYRIHTGTELQTALAPLLIPQEQATRAVDNSIDTKRVKFYWAEAIAAQLPVKALPSMLSFKKGDLIFILEQGMWWRGVVNGQTGTLQSSKIKRCISNFNQRLSGQLFHELSILLLEVAFQRPLAEDAMKMWTAISSPTSLSQYLGQLQDLTRRTGSKMGSAYADIIKHCLSNISWLDVKGQTGIADVLDSQHSCMEKIHQPMLNIRASGFRASRRPIKRTIANSLQARRPYHSTAIDSRYGSAPSAAYDYAVSSTAMVSGTAGYSSAALSESSYRPYSTDAVVVSYDNMVPAYPVYSEANAKHNQPIAFLRPAATPMAPRMDGLVPMSPVPMSVMIQRATHDFHHPGRNGSSPSDNASLITNIGGTETSTKFILPSLFTDKDSVAPQFEYLYTDAVDVKHLSWTYPSDLSYKIFADVEQRPVDVQHDDHHTGESLEAVREATLSDSDTASQLRWASDALDHVDVAENNEIRAAAALSTPYQSSTIHQKLRQDAMNTIIAAADQGHPHATYFRAKWSELGMFGYDLDKARSLHEYKMAADQGHSGSCYRAALLFEANGKLSERDTYFDRALKQGSGGALYRQAMSVMQGINGETQDTERGLKLFLQAVTVADSETPQALYVAGLLFAHELPFADKIGNLVSLDNKRAVTYFKRAARYGFSKAQLRLGAAYETAQLGLSFSIPLALHYYILAARRGEAEAEMGISKVMLAIGHGDDRQDRPFASAAYTYAKRAAMADLPTAQFAVGYCHELGIHVTADKTKAIEWYEEAVAQGAVGALERLERLRTDTTPSSNVAEDNTQQEPQKASDDQVEHAPRPASTSIAQEAQTLSGNNAPGYIAAESSPYSRPLASNQLQMPDERGQATSGIATEPKVGQNATVDNRKRRSWMPKLTDIKGRLQQK